MEQGYNVAVEEKQLSSISKASSYEENGRVLGHAQHHGL